MTQVVTQLIVDSSGAKRGVAEFEAAMAKAKKAAVEGGLATASSFESAQKRWTESLGKTDPVIKAQIAMERELAKQRKIGDDAVKLGIATQSAAQAQLERVRKVHEGHVDAARRGVQEQSRFNRAMADARAEAAAFAAQGGVVTGTLASLGKAGIVAGAAIAAYQLTFNGLVGEANRLADNSGKMVDFAETTGLTTTQLQALQRAAAGVGIDTDKVGQNFERFSVQMEELRRGTGALYQAMNRIDPAMTLQLAQSRDLGEAWEIFARAINRADRELANAASKAAFGRGGIPMTRLAGATIEAGGISGLEEALGRANVLTNEQLKRWDQLKDQIDITGKTARDNIASIFTDEVLERELKFYETLLAISIVLKESKEGAQSIKSMFGQGLAGAMDFATLGMASQLFKQIASVSLQVRDQAREVAAATAGGRPAAGGATFSQRFGAWGDSFSDRFGNMPSGRAQTRTEFDLQQMRERIAILGSAATATDRLAVAEKELEQKVRESSIAQAEKDKLLAAGRDALRFDLVVQQTQAMVSALGGAATASEQLAAREIALAQQLRQGMISRQTYNRALREADFVAAQAVATMREQLGVASEEEILVARLSKVRHDAAVLGITDATELARAQEIARKEAREAAEQLEVRASRTPGLTRWVLDAKNLDKQLDDLQLTAAQAFSSMVQEIGKGGDALQALLGGLDRVSGKMLEIGGNNLSAGFTQLLKGGGFGGFDPVSLGLGAAGMALSWITGSIKQREEERKKVEEAKRAWEGMTDQLMAFNVAADGFDLQPLTQELQSLFKEQQQLARAAYAAKAFDDVREIQATFGKAADRIFREFELGEPVLGEVAQKIRDVQLEGEQLVEALSHMDASAGHLAFAMEQVSVGIQRAIRDITASVERDLVRKINDLTGGGWINQLTDLAAEVADIRSVGTVDPTLVSRYLLAAVQDIVIGSELAGEAFAFVERMFPELAGSLRAFAAEAEAAADAIKRSADEIAREGESLDDRLLRAVTDATTLDGALLLQEREFQRQREEQQRVGGENMAKLIASQEAERFNLIRDFNQRAIDEHKRAIEEAQNFIAGITRRIREYIDSLEAGQNSPLSPLARLNAAQADFNTQRTLAAGGDRDALNSITQYHSNLMEAARAYYASGAPFQAIYNTSTAQLEGLPAQVSPEQFIVDNLTDAIADQTVAIIASLVSNFDTIDTNLDGLLTFAELQTALGATYSAGTLRSIFNTLDLDGDQMISKAEATRAALADAGGVRATNAQIQQQTVALAQVSQHTQSAAQALTGGGGSAVSYLALVDQKLANGLLSTSGGVLGALQSYLSPLAANNVHNSLRSIALMTIEQNARWHPNVMPSTGGGNWFQIPSYNFEFGGVAPPFSTFMYGEHHPQGPFFGRTGSQPLPITPAMPSFASNDNSAAVVDELKQLRAENRAMAKALGEIQARVGAATVGEIKTLIGVAKDTNRSAKSKRPQPAAA